MVEAIIDIHDQTGLPIFSPDFPYLSKHALRDIDASTEPEFLRELSMNVPPQDYDMNDVIARTDQEIARLLKYRGMPPSAVVEHQWGLRPLDPEALHDYLMPEGFTLVAKVVRIDQVEEPALAIAEGFAKIQRVIDRRYFGRFAQLHHRPWLWDMHNSRKQFIYGRDALTQTEQFWMSDLDPRLR